MPRRLFVDANVFVFHFADDPKKAEFPFNEAFLKSLENREYSGVLSTFVVAEILGAANRLLSGKLKRAMTPEELAALRETILQSLRDFGIQLIDMDLLGKTDLFDRAAEIVLNSKAMLNPRQKDWRSLGGTDALHLATAEHVDADGFATFDEAFKGTNSPVKIFHVWEEYDNEESREH